MTEFDSCNCVYDKYDAASSNRDGWRGLEDGDG